MKVEQVIIGDRYNGPPNSGNGGYVAGILAQYVSASAVQIRLFSPPPLNMVLDIIKEDVKVALYHDTKLIAEGISSSLELDVPYIPTQLDAKDCALRYPGFERHAFPRCYVCGPDRAIHDGLRLFTGISLDKTYVAAPFYTFDELYDDHDELKIDQIYAALDCPGAYAISQIDEEKVMVLGQITVEVIQPIKREEELVVVGWYLGKERKKNYSGTAIITTKGIVKAKAKATWIEINPDMFLNQNN
jgi:hypothetical protein